MVNSHGIIYLLYSVIKTVIAAWIDCRELFTMYYSTMLAIASCMCVKTCTASSSDVQLMWCLFYM